MARPKKSPGVGRNSDVEVEGAKWDQAVASEVIFAEAKDAMAELRKRSRSRAEEDGIVLADLDYVVKHRNDDVETLMGEFKRRLRGLLNYMPGIKGQVDLFLGAPPPAERQAAFRQQGKMAGMAGKAAEPPENLADIERELWLTGWHEGHNSRDAAAKIPAVAAIIKALKILEARVAGKSDETPGPMTPAAPKPGGGGKKLSGDQRQKALQVAGGQPLNDPPPPSPPASPPNSSPPPPPPPASPPAPARQNAIPASALNPTASSDPAADFRKDNPGVALPGDPGFEASAAELATQVGRKSQSQQAAEKLAEAGVVK